MRTIFQNLFRRADEWKRDIVIPPGGEVILQNDLRCRSLTIDQGGTIHTNGYRIYVGEFGREAEKRDSAERRTG